MAKGILPLCGLSGRSLRTHDLRSSARPVEGWAGAEARWEPHQRPLPAGRRCFSRARGRMHHLHDRREMQLGRGKERQVCRRIAVDEENVRPGATHDHAEWRRIRIPRPAFGNVAAGDGDRLLQDVKVGKVGPQLAQPLINVAAKTSLKSGSVNFPFRSLRLTCPGEGRQVQSKSKKSSIKDAFAGSGGMRTPHARIPHLTW